jgi:hypothetical protein
MDETELGGISEGRTGGPLRKMLRLVKKFDFRYTSESKF